MVVHLAHELALVARPVDQMPDAAEPVYSCCALCAFYADSKIAAMASAIRW